jgi:hypothetical protein
VNRLLADLRTVNSSAELIGRAGVARRAAWHAADRRPQPQDGDATEEPRRAVHRAPLAAGAHYGRNEEKGLPRMRLDIQLMVVKMAKWKSCVKQ